MWTYSGKIMAIAINIPQMRCIRFDDGTVEGELKAVASLKRGIFVNPSLDKKKYLSLLKVFHPDVSVLEANVATQIAQAIISAKDGIKNGQSPWKNNEVRRSADSKDSADFWSTQRWSKNDWSSSPRSNYQKSQSRSRQQKTRA